MSDKPGVFPDPRNSPNYSIALNPPPVVDPIPTADEVKAQLGITDSPGVFPVSGSPEKQTVSMRRRWQVKLSFEPRDIWIGLFWDREPQFKNIVGHPASPLTPPDGYRWRFFICILPMLPLLIVLDSDRETTQAQRSSR